MRTSSVGSSAGLTLLELLVALALAGMIMAISFPSATSGLDGVRLQASGRRVASFINAAREHAEREQVPVEVAVEAKRLQALAAGGGWERTLELTEGVETVVSEGEPRTRRMVLLPGVPAPRVRFGLRSSRGRTLTVETNPLTGVPHIEAGP